VLSSILETVSRSGQRPPRVDARTYIAVPGFINIHHHVLQTLTRSLRRRGCCQNVSCRMRLRFSSTPSV